DGGHEVRTRHAEGHLTAGARAWMRWRVPHTWGRVYAATGRHWRALESFQRAVVAASGDPTNRATSLQGCAEEAVRLASAGELATDSAAQRLEGAPGGGPGRRAAWATNR